MANIEKTRVSEVFLKEAEGGIDSRERAEIALQVLETQFAAKENLGKGKAAEVWVGDLPVFQKKVCVKTNYNPRASVNALSREFGLHEKFLKSGTRVPKPWMYVEGGSDASTPVQKGSLAMEAIEGQTLEEMITALESQAQQISPERVQAIIKDIEKQIKIAHQAGLYHRDLHLRNVMIDSEGKAWLIDFGDATEAYGASNEDEIYRSAVVVNGKAVTKVFPRDEDIIGQFKRQLVKRELIKKHDSGA